MIRNQKALWLIAIFLFSATLYVPTIFHDFVFDDKDIVQRHPATQGFKDSWRAFTMPYWPGMESLGIYRPLPLASYALNRVFLGSEPWGYHLVNVVLNGFVCVLVYLLFRSAIIALFFAALPIHVEAVSYIVGRAEILMALFFLAAWIFHRRERWSLAIICYLCSIFSKEHALFLWPIFLLDDWRARESDRRESLWEGRGEGETLREFIAASIRVYAGYLGGIAVYMLARYLALGRLWADSAWQYLASIDYLNRILTMAKFFFLYYFWPLVSGTHLCADFSPPGFPIAAKTDFLGWLSLLVLVILILGAIYYFYRRQSVTGFWIIFFFLPLLPASNFLIPTSTFGGQRYLYLPSLAFAALAANALCSSRKLFIVFFMVMSFFSAMTLRGGQIWKNNETLFRAVTQELPKNSLAHNMLGVTYAERGQVAQALKEFKTAVALQPESPSLWFNVATAYHQLGQLQQAVAAYDEVLKRDPNNVSARYHLKKLKLK